MGVQGVTAVYQSIMQGHPIVSGCAGFGSGSLDIPFCVCVCRCVFLHFISLSPSSFLMYIDAGSNVDVGVDVDVSVDIVLDTSVTVSLFTSAKRFHSSVR